MIPDAKIVILGGSGLIGKALRESLKSKQVTLLRSRTLGPGGYDVASGWIDSEALRGADTLINLAGSPIAVRWTSAARKEIHSSRADTTTLLVNTLLRLGITPRVVITMSGINRYAANTEAELDESSPLDDTTFLGGICRDWETPLAKLPPTTRSVILRTGVVIGPGGAMAKLAPVFRLGLGGRLSHGKQWMSWISLHDLVRLIHYGFSNDGLSGVVNAVSPEPVRNSEFTRILAQSTGRPAVFPVPAWALKLAYGQMAEETLLSSRRVVPHAALKAGFKFDTAQGSLEPAIRHALAGIKAPWRKLLG